MYIGGPVEALAWERSVIEAGQEMLNAHQYLRVYDLCSHSNTIAAGLQCSGPAGKVSMAQSKIRRTDNEHV
jgi:hypothetical protein